MNYIIIAEFLMFFVIFSEEGICEPKTMGECLDIYNNCMRPKVLDKAKVNTEWIRQQIKENDVDRILKHSPESRKEVKEKMIEDSADTLWDFQIQDKAVVIAPSLKESEKKLEYPDWKEKCTKDYEECILSLPKSEGNK